VSRWIGQGSPASLDVWDDFLTSRRIWRTELDGRIAEMPCGGTHVKNLSLIGDAISSFEMSDEETLIIRTSVR
jgi:alanyl-tRNA synthetase